MFDIRDKDFDKTSQQFHIHFTATLPFSQFIGFKRKIPIYNPPADYINQLQNNSTVTNRSNKANGITFRLNTFTTTIPALS